ncbi:DLA class II histocompatibility antigen, DR-1 beta chain-like isoform X3 [Crotalus tigris]|uniref:DLA class II histocompatibility antigen, DR-1 beta chain-like isoform X3 n=1 Tax=Crotalus tigris TaxID=88082 RepID=UPI00192F8050|nr:DLA class II histocompatibility antigen, DR-1 beta chain-like isoform X3 [Crotalus tigris]
MGSAGLPLMLLLVAGALARIPGSGGGKETPAHFLYQGKVECCFLNGTRRVRFLQRYIYDREEYLRFDSARGEFEALAALGKGDAEAFNRDKHELQDQKTGVDSFCRHNYEAAQSSSVVGRRAGPHFPPHHPLHREGLLPRGDRGPVAEERAAREGGRGLWGGAPEWRLDLPAPGDAGDPAPAGGRLHLPEPRSSNSARSKLWTGIVAAVIGVIFFAMGLSLYLKSKKATSIQPPAGTTLGEDTAQSFHQL